MKVVRFLGVIVLFTVCSAEKLCHRSKTYFSTNVFSYREPIASAELAAKFLTYPQIIPLLFGNFISNYRKANANTCQLIRGRHHRVVVQYARNRGHVLTILNHDSAAFPVRLTRSRLFVSVIKKTATRPPLLSIKFFGRPIRSYRHLRARNLYARAFVKILLDNARLVLGLGSCSSSLASVSGLCNNPFYPHYGAIFAKQIRPWNGPSLKLSDNLPNPRHVSNVLCKAKNRRVAKKGVNLLMIMFGQFLDHDMVLTPSGHTSFRDASFEMPSGDVQGAKMHLIRSDPLPFSPSKCCRHPYTPDSGEWNQFNRITSFIDAGTIYGSDHDRAITLRLFKHGKLILKKTKGGRNLPRNNMRDLIMQLENANDMRNGELYASGDVRANENPVLLALHTIFAREHNRICDLLRKALHYAKHKPQSDDWLYETARKIVIAELQNIVFNEFLPLMIGKHALGPYKGYKPKVDASMDIMFTTAAYRWGHTTLRNAFVTRSLNNRKRSFPLHNLFFNPKVFAERGVEEWLLGAMDVPAGGVDLEHADSVRDFLFNKKRGMMDLAAFNIARGRDHGLPGYIAGRQAYGLSGNGLRDITPAVRTKLLQVYKSAQHIDAFIGGLAEKPAKGALMGPFFRAVLTDQFRRLRDGDRFYYQNVNWGSFVGELPLVKKIRRGRVRLDDLIMENTRIERKHIGRRASTMQTASRKK